MIKYLATERRMEIALRADRGNPRSWFRSATIPTPFGPAMLEATSFRDISPAAAGGEDAVVWAWSFFSHCRA